MVEIMKKIARKRSVQTRSPWNMVKGWTPINIAAAAAILIGVHPFTIFQGDLVWTDLFLAIFFMISTICYAIFWKHNKASFLVLSGVFFGLAIATKTVAVVLLPAIFAAS